MSLSLFCFYAIFAFLFKASFSLPGNVSDHRALLSLKANIIGDPLPLQSWNHSTHFCSTLPNLEYFYIGYNLLRGRLPISISNATSLHHFDVRHNDFYGGVPSFSGLERLKLLALYDNPLGNGKSTDLDFMSSLLNSTATLLTLYLDNCNFGGVLPRFIANFSHLKDFQLEENIIGGYLPSEIHLLVNLQYLDLSENVIGGTIPSSWGGSLQQLIGLYLEGNNLFGEIPISLGNLSLLSELYLQFNELQGPLPVEIDGFKDLLSLNLSNNMFLGTLPITIGALSSLIELNINHNLFHGFIPPSFSSLKSLEILDLSCNNLTGKIPKFLGKLQYLKRLNLSFNHLKGEIHTEGIFKHKTEVELVGNNLCGEYEMGSDLSTFGDMYSYGILLLEIFTSKSPTSDIFNNGLTLHNYVRMSMPEQVTEIVDPKLFHKEANPTPRSLVLQNQITECLVSIFKIGIACSTELPRDRMNIGNVVKELHSIKDTLMELRDIRIISR
nr:probable LRR receptor-like serine/threonine-protein kinase At3g47570 [Ipomoea batatas]